MIPQFLIFLLGSGILYAGAEALIRGASRVALQHNVKPIVVGLTVVAIGTSLPEFVVNFIASFRAEQELALGNIIGSNISNIGLIIGITAVLMPLSVRMSIIKKEYPFMMAVMVLFYLMSWDGVIALWNGLIFIAGLVFFLIYMAIDIKRNPSDIEIADFDEIAAVPEKKLPTYQLILLILVGMIGLSGGAHLMVVSAVNVAEALGISRTVIGLTVVAVGTSLPELAASIVAVLKKEGDLSIGNVLGSNIFNVLFVVGFVSLITPLPVGADAIRIHFPVMLIFGILILPMALIGRTLSRLDGSLLLLLYLGYIAYLIWPYV